MMSIYEEFEINLKDPRITIKKDYHKMTETITFNMSLGKDINGEPIFPGDIVSVDGQEMRIEYGIHREIFGFGNVHGYYVPDYCEKIIKNEA